MAPLDTLQLSDTCPFPAVAVRLIGADGIEVVVFTQLPLWHICPLEHWVFEVQDVAFDPPELLEQPAKYTTVINITIIANILVKSLFITTPLSSGYRRGVRPALICFFSSAV